VKTMHVSAAFVGIGLFLQSASALAQSTTKSSPLLVASSGVDNDWSAPAKSDNYQFEANKRHLGIGLSMSGFIVGGRWEVANGGVMTMDVVWRRALNRQNRFELGAMARFAFTPDALLVGAGIPFRLVLKMHERLEVNLGIELSYTRIIFDLPFFPPSNGLTGTGRWEIGYLLDPKVSIGITPLALSTVVGQRVDPLVTYEPGVWVRFSPL